MKSNNQANRRQTLEVTNSPRWKPKVLKNPSPELVEATNIHIQELLQAEDEPVQERIVELRKLRGMLKRNGFTTADVSSAIRQLEKPTRPTQLILSEAPFTYAGTINGCHQFNDHLMVQSFGHAMVVANRYMCKKKWYTRNLGFTCYAVLERHDKNGLDTRRVDDEEFTLLPHWHILFKPAAGMQQPLENERLLEALTYACLRNNTFINKMDKLIVDLDGREVRYPVFDHGDIDLQPFSNLYDDQNWAGYMQKNIHRQEAGHSEQWGIGLYHFNRDGLVKLC